MLKQSYFPLILHLTSFSFEFEFPDEVKQFQERLRAKAAELMPERTQKEENRDIEKESEEILKSTIDTFGTVGDGTRFGSQSAKFKASEDEVVSEKELLEDWGGDLGKAFKRFGGR